MEKAQKGDLIRVTHADYATTGDYHIGKIAEVVAFGTEGVWGKFPDGDAHFVYNDYYVIHRKAGEEDEKGPAKCDMCREELGKIGCTSAEGGSFCSTKCADDMDRHRQAHREAELVASKPQADAVNHPNHYTQGRFETIEIIEEVTQGYSDGYVSYCVGNALKYLARAPFKHESPAEDIFKAKKYLDFAIKRLEGAEQ